jgi:hypothetical protein
MHERAKTEAELKEPRAIATLWFAVLAGPAAWIVGLEADYSLVRIACAWETMLPLHLVTVATLSLAAAGGLVARRQWERVGRGWPGEGWGPEARSRFMAVIGMLASAFFAVAIVAQWISKLFLHPCMAI